jgi:thioredoxin reductase (NADPH)
LASRQVLKYVGSVSLTLLVVLTTILVVALAAIGAIFAFRREDAHREALKESVAAGVNQPASLHPVVDLEACLCSGACVEACPEQVLGIIDGVTQMVRAGECIGHGRCHAACPVQAISLVFGTSERGVDIPLLRAAHESNVDGIFIVGELGGMGLIRNAMRQGTQVPEAAQRAGRRPEARSSSGGHAVDVLIVGAGPAGIACALRCVELGLSYELLEQYALGGSVMHYPRRKLVFTEVIKLPIVGKFGKSEMLKEELVAEFERVVLEAKLTLREGRRVTAVGGRLGAFEVTAETEGGAKESYRARTVVLAVGRRGTPRKLEVPGEDQKHVVYRLQDAEQYRHRKVLVVGGGDSAIESAVSVAQAAGSTVHLSYRGDAFFRIKKKNRDDLEAEVEAGRITLHLQTNVVEVGARTVKLKGKDGKVRQLEVDDVVVQIGGVVPTAFLESMGVKVETKMGEKVDMGDSARQVAERITSGLQKVGDVSSKFAKAGTEFVKTTSMRLTGKSSSGTNPATPPGGAPKPSTKAPTRAPGADDGPKRIGRLPARREVIATTDELTPFTSDDKLPPVPDSDIVAPRSRPELEDPSSDEGPQRPATKRS